MTRQWMDESLSRGQWGGLNWPTTYGLDWWTTINSFVHLHISSTLASSCVVPDKNFFLKKID